MVNLSPPTRAGRAFAGVVAFFALFGAGLGYVSIAYVLPMLDVYKDADPQDQRRISAYAMLMMVVLLVILFSGMILALRAGGFLRATQNRKPKPTEYVDAWTESARRLKVPPRE